MDSFAQRCLTALVVVFGLAATYGAPAARAEENCASTPAGMLLRIWTAPSWCGHCVDERDFMESQHWTRYIPMSLDNGHVVRIPIQICDMDNSTVSTLSSAAGVKGVPSNDLLIDGKVVGRGVGGLISTEMWESFFRQVVPGASHGRLPEQLPLPPRLRQ